MEILGIIVYWIIPLICLKRNDLVIMKKLINPKVSLILICLAVFITTATNTVLTAGIILSFFLSLVLGFLISIIVDYFKKTNGKIQIGEIFIVSIFGLIVGIFAIYLQEKLNQNTAKKFITRIEEYKKQHGKYPNENQIKIPKSINGILIEDMEYRNAEIYETDYIIRYFDGFWDYKVYRSDNQQWYIDD